MNIVQIIYQETKEGEIVLNHIWNYINKPGVWALFGKIDEKYICLNVGKAKDVGREILYDISCLHYLPSDKDGLQRYINQFGEDQSFTCESGWTQEYLYPRLRKYDELAFIYVYSMPSSEHEKKFAWMTKAKYWRNGKVFTTKRDGYYDKNKKEYLNEKNCFYESNSVEAILKIIEDIDW